MKKIALLFLLFVVVSCKKDKCEDILCFTPPQPFLFELVDKTTGDNLFSIGELESSNIKVLNEESEPINFTFISENEYNIIDLSEIGWNMGINYYTISVDDIEFSITLEIEEKHENCCTFFELKQFEISNYQFEQSNTTGIYTIKID